MSSETLIRKKNKSKMDIMVSLPEGVGITVKPHEYVAGTVFSNLPSNYFSDITAEEAASLNCVYTYSNVPVSEGYPIKYVDDPTTVDGSSEEEIFHGQIYANPDNSSDGIYGYPTVIFVSYDIGGKLISLQLASDLIYDAAYDGTGPGSKYYIAIQRQAICPIVDLDSIKLWKLGSGLGAVPEDVSYKILYKGQYSDALGAQYIIVSSLTAPPGTTFYITATISQKELAFVEYTTDETIARYRHPNLTLPAELLPQ